MPTSSRASSAKGSARSVRTRGASSCPSTSRSPARTRRARTPPSSRSCASCTRAGCDVAGSQRRISPVITFSQAAERHLDDVYGYLAWFTGDRFVAEDLAAETFERGLRLWHRFDERRGSPRTWLCQLARTVALDHFRSERRRLSREERAAVPDRYDEPLTEGLSPELESALRALTAGEREVIALRVVLELAASTAARALGISTTNCTTRLARALKKLEEALDVAA